MNVGRGSGMGLGDGRSRVTRKARVARGGPLKLSSRHARPQPLAILRPRDSRGRVAFLALGFTCRSRSQVEEWTELGHALAAVS